MQVTSENFDQHYDSMFSLLSRLRSMKDSYCSDEFSSIDSNVRLIIGSSGWNDKVSNNLKTKVEKCGTLTTSLESTLKKDLNNMFNIADQLTDAAVAYADERDNYYDIDPEDEEERANSRNKQAYYLDQVNKYLKLLEEFDFGSDISCDEFQEYDQIYSNGDNTSSLMDRANEVKDGVYKVEDYYVVDSKSGYGVYVDVYIDSTNGNRIYVNKSNGKVAIVCKSGDSLNVWFTTTSDSNYYGGWGGNVESKTTAMLVDHRPREYNLNSSNVKDYKVPLELRSNGPEDGYYEGIEEALARINKANGEPF